MSIRLYLFGSFTLSRIFNFDSLAAERRLSLARRFNAGKGGNDSPVAERRLSEDSWEQRKRAHHTDRLLIVFAAQPSLPRLELIIARSPALKRRAKLKRRSAAGKS
jgi:hypothetical protein